jgi:Fe-Mn family superoxide dismutase
MKPFEAKTFSIPTLDGISAQSIEEHIGLYQGYVKNFNDANALMQSLMGDGKGNFHAISEIARRLSFEFGGMRLHEIYFSQLEGGAAALDPNGALAQAINAQYPSDNAQERIMKLLTNYGSMRGPGWAILYWDPVSKQLLTGFSGEQHQGHFVTLPIVLALDVWEHTYVLDYGAAGKGKYIEAFFKNLNWSVVEANFARAQQ